MCAKILFLVVVAIAAAVASPVNPDYASAQAPASYDFQYGVKDDYSGNDFGQQETREGLTTQGSYYVNLPDGRVLRVTYRVTPETGYVAEVTYEGEAQYS